MLQTRCAEAKDAEKLRQAAEEFLDKTLHTDVPLIFAPSQVTDLNCLFAIKGKLGYM